MNHGNLNCMHPDDAKSKWCPEARNIQSWDGSTHNRDNGLPTDETMCLGRKCMAWRWACFFDPEGREYGYCGKYGRVSTDGKS